MVDYSKMKNSELEALLKQRSLPHHGKKADMVQRLVDADKGASGDGEAGQSAAAAPAAQPETKPATAPAKSSDSTATKPAPAAKPAEVASEATKTDTEAPKDGEAPATETEPAKPAVDFSTGLAATSIDDEIARRKKRAAKFGISNPNEAEALKNLERQKRFATGPTVDGDSKSGVNKLDQALPERTNRKRDRAENEQTGNLDDPGLKRRRGGGARGRGRGGRAQGGRTEGANGSWMNDSDKKAADARKARFG